ncbi:MAG TPA: hypothetical protein VFQ38_01025 [Longimicrobiales bacterium]|nr:hypothetical protein [Longimicrobiales bacterium]
MIGRPIAFAIGAMALLPSLARAQESVVDPPPPSRFTVTPFLGYGFSYTQNGTVQLQVQTSSGTADYQRQERGGAIVGVTGGAHLRGPFSAVATLAVNPRGTVTTRTTFPAVEDRQEPGGTMYIGKLGLRMDFHETDAGMQQHRASAALSFGPALVHESLDDPQDVGRGSMTRLAVNAGAVAELPLPWKNASFSATVEDYVLFLDDAAAASQMSQWVIRKTGLPAVAQVSAGSAHLYVARAGVSFRF